MQHYNKSKNKRFHIVIVLNRIFKGIISAIIFLILLELLLQISGLVYVKSTYRIKNPKILKEKSLRIMFIGDSWTQGADAAPMPGYVPLTIEKLNQICTGKNVQGYNFAWGSTNSSQAIHQFLDNYRKIKPHILVVMTGANNGWNTQDILTARKRIRNEIHISDEQEFIKFSEYIINNFKKLKIIKLYKLIQYNLVYKPKEIKFPFGKIESKYTAGYMQTLNETKSPQEAREYLLRNFSKPNYNDFFKLILHSFGGNIKETQKYLKDRNLWTSKLIKGDLNFEQIEMYKESAFKILEDDLTNLKSLCDQENIKIIIENYPHLAFESVNNVLKTIASKLQIAYVDHYKYFEENIGYEEWKKIMTLGHVNYKGHEYMAVNLTAISSNIIKSYFGIRTNNKRYIFN